MVSQTPAYAAPPVVAFAGGGTGGHMYPALAVGDILRRRLPGVRFIYFGTSRAIDQRVLGDTDCELVRQNLKPLSKVPWRWPGFAFAYWRTSRLCRAQLERVRPMVMIGTGGLSSVPAMRQARRAGVPTVVLNPDAVPGRANRHLATLADMVFLQWEETREFLPAREGIQVSGCAIRSEFNRADRAAGAVRFGLDPKRKTLLVTGASQGARTINEAVLANIELLEEFDDWQVLHLTGDLDFEQVKKAYQKSLVRAVVLPFTDRMAEALAAADLVLSRSGASTLAEITAVGRASVLMPYPFHKDMHQRANARCLVRASAARMVHDAADPRVNGPALRSVLQSLMGDAVRRGAMADAARRIGRGKAAREIADRIIQLAVQRGAITEQETMAQSC